MKGSPILHPLSALYGAAVRARLSAYSRGLISPVSLGVPTISVGNITAGGTGKTPLVEWMCRKLAQEGRKVGVLTRGYRRDSPQSRVLVSDGVSLHANVWQAGDEAFLVATKLLGIAVVISDVDRAAAGKWARRRFGLDAFVLDDGFQHLRLYRDLNVLVIDATDPWGGNKLLPYGRLREPLSEVRRADCIVITRAEEPAKLSTLITKLRELGDGLPILTSRMRVRAVKSLASEKTCDQNPRDPIAAFCGIGNPTAFFEQLWSLGYNLVVTRSFPDHYRYRQRDIDLVVAEAGKRGAQSLITTAKDAVKLHDLQFRLPCHVLEVEIEIDQESQFLELLSSLPKAGDN